MKNLVFLTFIGLLSWQNPSFLAEQLRFPRVRQAQKENGEKLDSLLKFHQLKKEQLNILFVVHKAEDELLVFGKSTENEDYMLINQYSICAKSGNLGPKNKQGDLQVPEGLYHIDRFNPASSFHLSLGINYPNLADKKRSTFSNLGGDIFIHGSCVTIGCLPLTDKLIDEVYLLAVYAKNAGQTNIPVYIFPFKMVNQNFEQYAAKYRENEELLEFWKSLKQAYTQFFAHPKKLNFTIDSEGNYQTQ